MKRNHFILVFSLATAVPLLILFCNYDAVVICSWGRQLLECLFEGRLCEYAVILKNRGMITNYPLITNVIVALWLLPAFAWERFLGAIPIEAYTTWYKVLIGFCAALSVREFACILHMHGISERDDGAPLCCLIASPVFSIALVGGGQVDAFTLLLLLIAFRQIMEGRTWLAAVFCGLSVCIKGLAVLIVVPWAILLLRRHGAGGKILAATALIVVANRILQDLLVENYSKIAALKDVEFGTWDRVFVSCVNNTSPFILAFLLVCFFCFYLTYTDRVRMEHLLLAPSVLLPLFLMFTKWFPQYLIPFLPWPLLLVGEIRVALVPYLSSLFASIGCIICFPIENPKIYESNGMLSNALLGVLFKMRYSGPYIEEYLLAINHNIVYVGGSMLTFASIAMLVSYFLYKRGLLKENHLGSRVEHALIVAEYIPVTLFIVASLLLFFRHST